MFRGCSFSMQLPGGGPLATSATDAIEQHGGRIVAPGLPLSSATHVVVQHQQQDAYAEADQHRKAVVTCYWILACAAAKQILPCAHPTHKPFPSSAMQGAKAYGVSVTAFQGMQRQILLDLLRCMGVGVQKQMHMGTATHVVAQNVDDDKSEKLAYARKPEWAGKVSIVNCKWVYDCVSRWQILPADGYKQNCSSTDVTAWQGGSGEASKAQPALPPAPSGPADVVVAPPTNRKESHSTTAAAPFQHLIASCLQPFKSPIVSSSAQQKQQLNSGRKSSSTVRAVATPVGLGAGLGTSKQRPSRGQTLQASLLPAAAANLDAASAMEDEQHGRDSLGRTQGAVTGLAHMALQKHNNPMPAASAGASVESQGLGMQVADAEAATARLVAHMTESSPNQNHEPLQLLTAHKAGDVLSAHDNNGGQRQQQLQPQQQHSLDVENIPQVQQHAGKRGSTAQSEQAVAAAGVLAGGKKQPAKRRKVSKDIPAVHPTTAEGGGSGKADGLPPDAKEVVGRVVQEQFEAGIFKGVVKSYMKKHKWFRIEYEDGDRQDLTWEELQPILLPAASEAEPASKPKRKLHPAETHTWRLQPKTATQQAPGTDAVPSPAPVSPGDADRKAAKFAQAGKRRAKIGSRNEAVPAEEEKQAVLAEEPTRADTPAGPRANMGNCPKAAAGYTPCSSAGKKPRVLIALGSMHTQEQQAYSSKLAKIGVACVSHTQCPRWKPEITHVVLPSLVRSVKSLAGMAAGCWILHADFVEASASAEALVDPEEYELDNGTALVSPNVPNHWRQRMTVHGIGAFHQLHVLLYGACDRPGPSKDDIALIVQAGEGTVANCEKPSGMLSRAISGGVQLAVMSTDKQASDPGVKQLLKAKVPCAPARFLIDWLAHPRDDLAGHLLFGSKMAWNADLKAAAESRTVAAKPQPMSPQI